MNRFPVTRFPKVSYAQLGEDIIIAELLRDCPPMKYLDIGCNDPMFFSNTFYMYGLMWKGIAVDACEEWKDLWEKERSDDIFICSLVGEGEYDFAKVEPMGLSTAVWKDEYQKKTNSAKIKSVQKMLAKPISTWMTSEVKLLTIDVEGMDFDVLKTNNWEIFKPYVVSIETWDSFKKCRDDRSDSFLAQYGYEKVADTGLNTIYARKEVYDAWKQVGRLDYFNII